MSKYINILEFIPKFAISGKQNKEYPIEVEEDNDYLMLNYSAALVNSIRECKREYNLTIPKSVSWNNETFEVLGLLQAEMTKARNGSVVFCNHEYKIINKVMRWFKREFKIDYDCWGWYII